MTTMRERWERGEVGDRAYIGWLELESADIKNRRRQTLNAWNAAQAENGRLRAALRHIADRGESGFLGCDEHDRCAICTARAALGEPESWQARKRAQQDRENEAEFLSGAALEPEPDADYRNWQRASEAPTVYSRPYVSADDEARRTIAANWPDEPKTTAASGTVGLEDSAALNVSVSVNTRPPHRFGFLRGLWRGLRP